MDIPSYREPARHLINNAPGWPCRLDLVSPFQLEIKNPATLPRDQKPVAVVCTHSAAPVQPKNAFSFQGTNKKYKGSDYCYSSTMHGLVNVYSSSKRIIWGADSERFEENNNKRRRRRRRKRKKQNKQHSSLSFSFYYHREWLPLHYILKSLRLWWLWLTRL